MKLAPFPDYRSCNLDWAETIPTHWREGKLRWLSTRFAGGTPDRANEAYWNDGTIPWLASGAVNQFDITEPSEYISEEGFKNSSARWVPRGGLVVALAGQGKTKGMVAQLHIEATCNQSMAAIIPQESLTNRFLLYWLSSNYQNIRNLAGGDLRDGLNLDLLGSISCPIPPIDEQRKISKFLDCETAKIDSLVAEQEKLIELLKEKRQAVISHAVTKGLNPKTLMKDSGIEWLGEVPEHWEVVPLSFGIGFQEGPGILAVDFHQEGVPLVRVSGVQGRWVTLEGCNFLDFEKVQNRWEHFRLRKGDLLISASASMGTVSEVGSEAVGAIPYTGLIRLWSKDDRRLKKEFISAIMASTYFHTQAELLRAGATIQHFGPTHLRRMKILLPEYSEQEDICGYIQVEYSKIDNLMDEANRAIVLLKERRSALISAAVTGKIDVRGLVDAEAA